jgi:hypothetical protein
MATLGVAATLPTPERLQSKLNKTPITISVVEPHMSSKQKQVRVDYVGYPAEEVFSIILGPKWANKNTEIEFRALDAMCRAFPQHASRNIARFIMLGTLSGKQRCCAGTAC